MLVTKCIYPKSSFAKCTQLACLLTFASLFKSVIYLTEDRPKVPTGDQ